MTPEAWLRGPIEGVDPFLMPAAHALVQAGEDLERVVPDLRVEELWVRPGGAASLGFHLRHIAGSIDRLLTYARGESLSIEQRRNIPLEGEPGTPPADAASLLQPAQEAIRRALLMIRSTHGDAVLEPRSVGRAGLPSTTLGLLFHVAEHTARHVGQIITTKKVIRGLNLAREADTP